MLDQFPINEETYNVDRDPIFAYNVEVLTVDIFAELPDIDEKLKLEKIPIKPDRVETFITFALIEDIVIVEKDPLLAAIEDVAIVEKDPLVAAIDDTAIVEKDPLVTDTDPELIENEDRLLTLIILHPLIFTLLTATKLAHCETFELEDIPPMSCPLAYTLPP